MLTDNSTLFHDWATSFSYETAFSLHYRCRESIKHENNMVASKDGYEKIQDIYQQKDHVSKCNILLDTSVWYRSYIPSSSYEKYYKIEMSDVTMQFERKMNMIQSDFRFQGNYRSRNYNSSHNDANSIFNGLQQCTSLLLWKHCIYLHSLFSIEC